MMSIDDRKPLTVRLDPDLYAQAQDAAKQLNPREGDPLMGPFSAWCVRQIVLLTFLSEENREFLQGMLRELGQPWHALDLINALISAVRKEVRAGRLRPMFCSWQINSSKKKDAR